MNTTTNNIADKIRDYINKNKISIREFARRMGVSPSAAFYWITEKNTMNVINYLKFCELICE